MNNQLQHRATGVRARVGALGSLALLLALFAYGCEGDNAFAGDGVLAPQAMPAVISITAQQPLVEGSRIELRVTAYGQAGVAGINVRVRGSASLDTLAQFQSLRADTTTALIAVQLPAAVTDTVLIVEATATDTLGRTSASRQVTFAVQRRAGPRVLAVTGPAQAVEGVRLDLRVRALAPRGLNQVVVRFRGATESDQTINVSPARSDTVLLDVTLPMPDTARDSVLVVETYARDISGAVSEIHRVVLPVTRRAPPGGPVILAVTGANQAVEGARLDLRVRAVAPRGLNQVTVRFRRGVETEQVIAVTPARTDTVLLDVTLQMPDTARDSTLVVEAIARDVSGAVSEIYRLTLPIIDRTAPAVSVSSPLSAAAYGGTVRVRVSASDPLGLSSLGYAVITDLGDTLAVTPASLTVSGAARDTTFTFRVPESINATSLRIIGNAANLANLRGVSSPLVLQLRDTIPPIVLILEPFENESFTVGAPIRTRTRVADFASGLSTLTLQGVAFRFFPDTLQNSPVVVRYPMITVPFPQGPDRPLPIDTVIVRDLFPNTDATSEPVYIIARATDVAGNTAVDTVRVVPGPRIAILAPVEGTVARAGGQMPIRVQAYDPAVGIDSLKIVLSGVVNQEIPLRNLNATREQVTHEALVALPPSPGNLQIRAVVWNHNEVQGTSSVVNVTVNQELARDSIAPTVERIVQAPARVELGDSIRITVRATDGPGTGITEIGAVAVIIPADPSLPRQTVHFNKTYATPRTALADTTFVLRLRGLYSETGGVTFPQNITLQVHGYALDASTPTRNCAVAVQETMQSLTCAPLGSGYIAAGGHTGRTYNSQIVPGTSVRLQTGSVIADALPDTINRRLYLSNFARNRVEVLNLRDTIFGPSVQVGSQPWGLYLIPGRAPGQAVAPGQIDTLMVANSGGTNISFVPTDRLVEDSPKRMLTPNDVLWEVVEQAVNGYIRYTVRRLEFSDRPQFIAQDSNKGILYSTKPTSALLEGTLRLAIADPTPADPSDIVQPDVKLIFGREAVGPSGNTYAVARVDSIIVIPGGTNGDDQVVVYDHRAGFPLARFSRSGYIFAALEGLRTAPAPDTSDIFATRGVWNRSLVGFSDTTYVAASKNRSTIAFGEGHAEPFGRILLWTASDDPMRPQDGLVTSHGTLDLIGNAAETVNGVALNVDGSYGVARGLSSTYFFSNNAKQEGQLRLHGVFSEGAAGGSGGVALHPNHGTVAAGSNDNTMAFIGTGNRSIKIVDTFHYYELGEIPIRNNLIGQLRAVSPFPGVNDGVSVNSCDYIIAHLYALTAAEDNVPRVIMLDVRRKYLRPARSCT